MSFAAKVQCRAIPSENRCRKCKGQARKEREGKWEKPNASGGEASPPLQAAISTPRPRWADICEEEEDEKERNARAAAAADASGESENTVDHIEAEAANEVRASEGRRGRDKFGSSLDRASQRISTRVPSRNLFDLERHLTCEVPSSGRQSIILNGLSKGELWGSRGLRGL